MTQHREHTEPPEPPETPPPVMPGVGSAGEPALGTEVPGEEVDRETDPHPDTPDDFDEFVGDRHSEEAVIEKD